MIATRLSVVTLTPVSDTGGLVTAARRAAWSIRARSEDSRSGWIRDAGHVAQRPACHQTGRRNRAILLDGAEPLVSAIRSPAASSGPIQRADAGFCFVRRATQRHAR